jgi:hypothetical protein
LFIALLLREIAIPGLAAPAAAPEAVLSVAPPKETPVSARIAPSSSVPPSMARMAGARLSPLINGTRVFTVAATGSMRPAFDDNTVLLTEPAPFRDLQIGDIVVFRHRGTGLRVVHRIIERRDGGYWTKGDRSRRMDDDLVTEANFIGRVYGILYTSRSANGPLPDALRDDDTLMAVASGP